MQIFILIKILQNILEWNKLNINLIKINIIFLESYFKIKYKHQKI